MIIGKGCIRKPVSEWKCYRHLLCIVVPVSHENTLLIPDIFPVAKRKMGRIVGQLVRHGFRQLPAGTCPSVEEVCHGFSYGLSA